MAISLDPKKISNWLDNVPLTKKQYEEAFEKGLELITCIKASIKRGEKSNSDIGNNIGLICKDIHKDIDVKANPNSHNGKSVNQKFYLDALMALGYDQPTAHTILRSAIAAPKAAVDKAVKNDIEQQSLESKSRLTTLLKTLKSDS